MKVEQQETGNQPAAAAAREEIKGADWQYYKRSSTQRRMRCRP
jgi:hypothetical protein